MAESRGPPCKGADCVRGSGDDDVRWIGLYCWCRRGAGLWMFLRWQCHLKVMEVPKCTVALLAEFLSYPFCLKEQEGICQSGRIILTYSSFWREDWNMMMGVHRTQGLASLHNQDLQHPDCKIKAQGSYCRHLAFFICHTLFILHAYASSIFTIQ